VHCKHLHPNGVDQNQTVTSGLDVTFSAFATLYW
jgi:hypothetical protein